MKKILVTVVQAGITLALLWWIFRDGERRAMMWEALQTANWWWFLPGLAMIGMTTVLQTLRWKWLLAVPGIRPSFRRAYGMNLIGMFFNLFLPGGTGGDLIKMYYASRESNGRRAAAVLSVFMDRVVGLLALITIAAVVSSFVIGELWQAQALRAMLITLGFITVGAVGFLCVVFLVEFLGIGRKLPHWLPLRSVIVEMAAAFSNYARSKGALTATFLISIPTHCLIFSSFYFSARAFTDSLSLAQMFTVLPVILTISALPISVAGLGVREQLFKVCLGALFGVPEGIAVLIGFSGFLLSVIWGAVGGVLYIFYRPSETGNLSLSEMEEEMERAGEAIEQSWDKPAQ